MISSRSQRFLRITSMVCLLGLGGCVEISAFKAATVGIAAATSGVFSRPDVNLTEKNYAAADLLASEVNHIVSRFDVIRAEPLQEVDHPGVTSPLGRSIPEGVGLRLIDLGYNVQLDGVVPQENVSLYPAASANARYILSGVYAVKRQHVDVTLQIVDARTRVPIGRFDYDLLLSSEVRRMAQTEAQISKVVPTVSKITAP